VPADHIVLGGFSQGAMLALDVAALRARKPAALVLMSGSMVALPQWFGHAPTLKGLEIFMSHGRADHTLPFAVAEVLRDRLGQVGARVAWLPFDGGHEIPPAVVQALTSFLD
jgi:phospholipase/carboxylesterase